jgi:hypothetical protein
LLAAPRRNGATDLRPILARLAASYDRRLGGPHLPPHGVARACAAELRDTILAPVLAIATHNDHLTDDGLARILRVALGLHRKAPPPLVPEVTARAAARRDAAWGRERARVRRCLDEAGV